MVSIKRIGLALLAVLIIGYFSINFIMEMVIQNYGSRVLGVDVELGSVSISPFSGEGSLQDFAISNPKGFKSDHAFYVEEIAVKIDVGSIFSDKVIIEKIAIKSPRITYEVGPGGNNISALHKNISAANAGRSVRGDGSVDNSRRLGKKVVVDDVTISDSKVGITASIMPLKNIEVGKGTKLPDINLKDIGKDSGGVRFSEVGRQILLAINEDLAAANLGNFKGRLEDADRFLNKTLHNLF